ncbi:secreted phosphoprotein 24 [Clinocottus analis]|uniref:secreted phosphoprotein 24 n=1 Tax=Clinocottus analis TaxID=304258 RepID=UPI0035C266B8
MKSYMLLLALLQSLGCSGLPLHYSELTSLANRGLGAALAQVNSDVRYLYRVTRGSVKKIFPVSLNTTDLLMVFSIKETECVKASGNDPQTCALRTGFFVPTFSCSSRVRMSVTSAQVLSLRCDQDSSSSSSESSEEIFLKGRHQFNVPFINRVPAPPAPPALPPHLQPGRSHHGQTTEETRPRGDTFTNYLV